MRALLEGSRWERRGAIRPMGPFGHNWRLMLAAGSLEPPFNSCCLFLHVLQRQLIANSVIISFRERFRRFAYQAMNKREFQVKKKAACCS